jgi:hypothetical protein
MNAAKGWAAATVLGVSIAAFSCRQDLAPASTSVEPIKTEAGAERKAAAATYGDGDYTFFFKNGNRAGGDCDGYSSAPGGDTTIYEWWKSDIKKWAERLSAAGIRYEEYDGQWNKYCWVRFETRLLLGAAEERLWIDDLEFLLGHFGHRGTSYFKTRARYESDERGDRYIPGKVIRLDKTPSLTYVQPGEEFHLHTDDDIPPENSWLVDLNEWFFQPDRNTPVLVVLFENRKEETRAGARASLESAGIPILQETIYTFIVDASSVAWFAFDYGGWGIKS